MSGDDEADIVWVSEVFERIDPADAFAILRPTSPFRTAETIRRAYRQFRDTPCHSLRAMQPVREHPGKMWQAMNGYAEPLIRHAWPPPQEAMHPELTSPTRPFHSLPTQTLPVVYVQNASLEIAHSWVIPAFGTISGTKVTPFFTEGYEGFDLNTPSDWDLATSLVDRGLVALPALAPQTPTAPSQ
jgi:N-acylneuraminate cytidylyltransferase